MYVFIVNPIAGSGRAERIFADLQKSALYQGLSSQSFFTKAHGHAEKIVRTLVETDSSQIRAIIIIGGDGTMHEVMNGVGANPVHVAMIPSGSGNDFARATATIKNRSLFYKLSLKVEKTCLTG